MGIKKEWKKECIRTDMKEVSLLVKEVNEWLLETGQGRL